MTPDCLLSSVLSIQLFNYSTFQLLFSVPPQPQFLSCKPAHLGATHEGVWVRITGALYDDLLCPEGAGSRTPGGNLPRQNLSIYLCKFCKLKTF